MNVLQTILYLEPLFVITVASFSVIILLSLYLLRKIRNISVLKRNINQLNQAIQELDHQAKLIIKSDVELKLYQEEVEDKLNKLSLLKSLILSSIHVLDREQIYSQIEEKTVNDLGFKRGLIVNFNDLAVKCNINFGIKEIEAVKSFLQYKKDILKLNPLLSSDYDICQELIHSLQSRDFLIAPIKARENIYAIFILSDLILSTDIKRAEKEIFSIICMYLGQCFDNIKLFEDLYHTKDELEKKVKERTNELVKTLREIEIISKKKSEFISGVSHELRTPLTSIKGFSSLLAEEKFGQLPEEAKKRLEKIDENVNKLVDMVNTLLDIARIESGKMEIKIAPADVVKIIRDAGELLAPQIQTKGVSLILDLPNSMTVYIDKNLIERVFINLINNATKFTPKGGEIRVSCKRENSHAVIAVSDTGCGIDKGNLDKLFQEFFRVDNPVNREVRGSGLGLSLVKRIIETHKENIWVESEVGKGTKFYFTLKLAENV
jgi:signal transduction histidine kinase